MSRKLAGILAFGLVACGREPAAAPDVEPREPAIEVVAGDPETDLLALLLPLPASSLQVNYGLRGPEDSRGSLQLWTLPGGWLHQSWRLESPSGQLLSEGRRVETPRLLLSQVKGNAARIEASSHAALLEAFARLDSAAKVNVVRLLSAHLQELAKARAADRSTKPQIQGESCLPIERGGEALCLWEDARLPLRFRGQVIELQAQSIVRDAAVPPELFAELQSKRGPAPAAQDVAKWLAALQALASGEASGIWPLLEPLQVVPIVPALAGHSASLAADLPR